MANDPKTLPEEFKKSLLPQALVKLLKKWNNKVEHHKVEVKKIKNQNSI